MGDYSYSPAQNTFYANALKETMYDPAGQWPGDAVDVDDDAHRMYTDTPPTGKMLGNNAGHPAWVDIPPLTHEALVAVADAEKQNRITAANNYINSKQWPGKTAMGRLTDADKAQYNLWLDYLDVLEVVDTSTAPDIEWPVQPV